MLFEATRIEGCRLFSVGSFQKYGALVHVFNLAIVK